MTERSSGSFSYSCSCESVRSACDSQPRWRPALHAGAADRQNEGGPAALTIPNRLYSESQRLFEKLYEAGVWGRKPSKKSSSHPLCGGCAAAQRVRENCEGLMPLTLPFPDSLSRCKQVA